MGSINSYTTPRVYSSVHNVYTCIQLCAIFVMYMHPLPIAEKVCVLWQRASCIHAVNTGEPPRWGWAEATVLPGGMRGSPGSTIKAYLIHETYAWEYISLINMKANRKLTHSL